MSDTAVLNGPCSTSLATENKGQGSSTSFGHKTNSPVLKRDVNNNPNKSNRDKTTQEYTSSSSSSSPTSSDPLEELDKIEVVQQSDTTIHYIADEEVIADNNLSCISNNAPIPIQLFKDFETNMEKLSKPKKDLLLSPEESTEKQTTKRDSPHGVEQLEDDSPYISKPSLKLPHFELHESLKLNLSQSVLNRCSFYSVIHGVNKAVQDMANEDKNGAIEETQDEESALVRAVNGPTKVTSRKESPTDELAVLDEEKFLLTAIDNRDEHEMLIRACPETFAEAIGEVEPGVLNESPFANGQSENPLSVLASSRTQLWKPSRSWWEAKSGKNPWIEPKNHNKRWRYLWPLIHYHKFLAKCIKKLKRNNIDVKSSMNPVPAFLREEVCAVSDHLAAASKFTSEDWMNGLPHFNGWTAQCEEKQRILQKLIHSIPMRSLTEPSDVNSPLLKNQIDKCFLIAMAAARDKMENGAQETRNNEDGSINSDFTAPKQKSRAGNFKFPSNNGNKPPRYGGMRGNRSNQNGNGQMMANKHWRNQLHANNRMYGYHDQNMMMQPHMQPGYYPPQYNSGYHSGYVPNHYMHQSMNNSICGWNQPYGGNDYSNLNISMSSEWEQQQYYGNQFDPPMEHDASLHFKCDDSIANTSIASHNHFEALPHAPHPMHNLTQLQEHSGSPNLKINTDPRNSSNNSFDEGSLNGNEAPPMQTPCKQPNPANFGTPASPSWAHLHTVPGLTTPLAPQPGHHMFDASQGNGTVRGNPNWMNAKPLLISHSYSHFPPGRVGPVPPSPATQFTMSPQANSQNSAYFANAYGRQMPMPFVHQAQNPALDKTQDDCQTLTEETTSESTSDNEN